MPISLMRSGSFASDVLLDLIHLWGKIQTNGGVTHLRKAFTTVGYQVTAGKTLFVVKLAMAVSVSSGTVEMAIKLGYADNDVGLDTATARTNPVMTFGLDDGVITNGLFLFAQTSDPRGQLGWNNDDYGMVCSIGPAGKFPFMRAVVGSGSVELNIHAWCVEK